MEVDWQMEKKKIVILEPLGVPQERLLEMTGADDKNPTFHMGAEKIIAAGQKEIALEGPVPEMEEEIVAVHKGFWDKT